jgi:hypothetical protein
MVVRAWRTVWRAFDGFQLKLTLPLREWNATFG